MHESVESGFGYILKCGFLEGKEQKMERDPQTRDMNELLTLGNLFTLSYRLQKLMFKCNQCGLK